MNNRKNVYSVLLENYDYIISELEVGFLSEVKCSRESDVFINYQDLLRDRVFKFMKIYKLPKNCNWTFDPVRGFITQFWKTIYYKGTKCDAFTKTNKQLKTFRIVNEEERLRYGGVTEDMIPSSINVEEDFINEDELNRVRKYFTEFLTFLTPFEKLFFRGMYDEMSTESIIRQIGNCGFKPPSTYISLKKRDELSFRLVCFFAQEKKRIHSEEEILNAFNKYPYLNKRVFKAHKLYIIPSQELLEKSITGEFLKKKVINNQYSMEEKKEIVKRYDPNIKIHNFSKKYFARSKVDRNGKKHDHYVVYIDHNLNSYCHVTKQSQSLIKEVS